MTAFGGSRIGRLGNEDITFAELEWAYTMRPEGHGGPWGK